MSLTLEPSRVTRKGALRGRESRNQSLNTKLTPTESKAVVSAAETAGMTTGEWVRGLVLTELREDARSISPMVLLGEISALRLILVNTLELLLRGEKMSAEQFKAMLQYVKTNKKKAAEDAAAVYAQEGSELQ